MQLILIINFLCTVNNILIDLQTVYPVFMEVGVNNPVQDIVWTS